VSIYLVFFGAGQQLSAAAEQALRAAEAVVVETGLRGSVHLVAKETELHEVVTRKEEASVLTGLSSRHDYVVWLRQSPAGSEEVVSLLRAAGQTVELVEDDKSLASSSLSGWKVAVTRAASQAGRLVAQLQLLGGEVIEVPTIEIAPPADGGADLETSLSGLMSFSHICFTSVNAVEAVMERLDENDDLSRLVVAAVGPVTAAALAARGVRVDLRPATANAEALAGVFPPASGGERLFLPQGSLAKATLARALHELGYEVEAVEAYRTLPAAVDQGLVPEIESSQAITFTSPSSFENFCSSYGRGLLPAVIASIGPLTSQAIKSAGLPVSLEAERATTGSLVTGLARFARAGSRNSDKRPSK
jgi:uroporphyrinogen III methyltransferase/synthase